MISASDRRQTVELIDQSCARGVAREKACQEMGISLRTYQRWTNDSGVKADGRPTARRPTPANKLTPAEREAILAVCNSEVYQSLPPSQIVPRLADEGAYIASESSFYRVLREHNQLERRGKAQAPRHVAKPKAYQATAPNQLWSWDISVPQQAAGEMRDCGPSSSAYRCR